MQLDEIRKDLEERGIEKAKIGGFDIDGVLRGKFVSLDKLYSALTKGFGFCDVIFGWDIADELYDNAKVTGWHSGYPDAHAKLDPQTIRYYRHEPSTVNVLADFYDADGKPHPACPRNVLRKIDARAEAAGYRPMASCEFEFWVFKETPESMREKNFHGMTPLSPGMFGYSWLREGQHAEFLNDVIDTCAAYRIPLEGVHTETGPGVYEAALEYSDALEAADRAALFKTVVKQIAHRHGLAVTFMAKWSRAMPGSSGHMHQSLWDSTGEQNLFSDPNAKDGLSDLARHYIGGQVKLAPALTAVYAPFINSYKRYVPGLWAPLNATWGVENRTCAIRVINGPGEQAVRAEYRQTAADINPYLALAASIGAGLYGILHGIEPPAPVAGDATAEGTEGPALPTSLEAATRLLAESAEAKEVLGEAFVDHYTRTRDWESREYRKAVTDWELARYFEGV